MRVVLVDGTYELFRHYFGAPKAKGPDGREVGALRSLMRSLLDLLRTGERHIAVAFDHEIESFRNDLYAGYKTGEGLEPALWEQFHPAEAGARALGFMVWPMIEFEADDALASGAARYGRDTRVTEIRLASPDKDLMQCVEGKRIVVWDRRRDILYDHEGVVAKLGVPPQSVPDYLALVGDTADGYPGIQGWGARSASSILQAYGTIEKIPADPSQWTVKLRGAARLSESLEAGRKDAALFRELATLRRDAPIEGQLDEIEWRGADRGALEDFCEATGDQSLLRRITEWR